MQEKKHTNQLILESSPYLLQHAHNPVNWHPWGEAALSKAKKENKLLIISIGYSACHWCHVMEHESFEDEAVAQLMNKDFISIKVDREERPDIDQVYMNAIQLLSGRGGWPLNVIALPDGRPIYGGTYFNKSQWLDVLDQIQNYVKTNPDKTEDYANSLTNGVAQSEIVQLETEALTFNASDLNAIFEKWRPNIDFKKGGSLGAPKFPMPVGLAFLLEYGQLNNNQTAIKAFNVTLDNMAAGGIYDQIGGGFARYSTDEDWKVPHFEKMLYDNGQLVSIYSTAYQREKNERYKEVVYQTLSFIERELTSDEGGFFSALDADSEGVEGKFYVWKQGELDTVLGNDAELISSYYSTTKNGNWEDGNNVLIIRQTKKDLALKFGVTEDALNEKVKAANAKLLNERAKRVRPGLDDKILCAWNALMLKGYVDAYRAFNDAKMLEKAIANAEFLKRVFVQDDFRLFRNYKNGKSTINGFLDDYALTIEAFIALYKVTFNEQYLLDAKALSAYAIAHFFDEKSGMFYYTSNTDPELIARKMEVADNVIPASNSTMANNLFELGHYFEAEDYLEKSRQMLSNVKGDVAKAGAYYANWGVLMNRFVYQAYELAIVGENAMKIRAAFDTHYLPNVLFCGGIEEGQLPLLQHKLKQGKTTIYVCINKSCKRPVYTVADAIKLMNE